MRLRGRVAAFFSPLRGLGDAAHQRSRLGHTHANEAGGHLFACTEHDRLLQQRAGLVREAAR